METINSLLFGVYPYIALSVLVVGSVLRFDREQYTWRTGSSQLLRRKQLVAGSVLFHLGVLVIFGGHLVGLLTPIAVFEYYGVPHGAKLYVANGLSDDVAVVDTASATATTSIPVGQTPHSILIDDR